MAATGTVIGRRPTTPATDLPAGAGLLAGDVVARHLDVGTLAPWSITVPHIRHAPARAESDSSDGSCYSTADPAECNDSSDGSCYSTADPVECNDSSDGSCVSPQKSEAMCNTNGQCDTPDCTRTWQSDCPKPREADSYMAVMGEGCGGDNPVDSIVYAGMDGCNQEPSSYGMACPESNICEPQASVDYDCTA